MTDDADNPAKGITTKQPPPGTLRGAVAVWLALAAFELLTAVAAWLNRNQIRNTLLEQRLISPDKVDAAVRDLLVQNTLVAGLFAAAYIAFGLLLFRGKTWARIAITVAAALQLVVLISGLSLVGVLILGLIASGLVLSWLPTTSRWLAEVGAKG